MQRNLSLDDQVVYCHNNKYLSDDVELVCKSAMTGHRIVREQNVNSKQINTVLWCYGVLFFLVNIEFSVLNSELVEVPINVVVVASEPLDVIDMTCQSDYQMRLKWVVHKNNESRNNVLYNGYFLHPDASSYCSVLTDNHGRCSLRLSSTTDAAQTYTCVEPGSLREASADLICIKSGPVCINSSTKDLVNLTCSIEFRGNWAPTMEWIEQSSHGVKVLSVGVDIITVPDQRVTSTLVLEMPERSRNYTCTTKFDIRGKKIYTTATNVPDYIRVWTSSVLSTTQDSKFSLNLITLIVLPLVIIVILWTTIATVFKFLKNRRDQTKLSNDNVTQSKDSFLQENATSAAAQDCCKIKPEEYLTLVGLHKEA